MMGWFAYPDEPNGRVFHDYEIGRDVPGCVIEDIDGFHARCNKGRLRVKDNLPTLEAAKAVVERWVKEAG